MAMKSSSVSALETVKITKTKWSEYYGTPCKSVSVSVSIGKILRSPECIRIPEARWRGVKHGAGHVIYC